MFLLLASRRNKISHPRPLISSKKRAPGGNGDGNTPPEDGLRFLVEVAGAVVQKHPELLDAQGVEEFEEYNWEDDAAAGGGPLIDFCRTALRRHLQLAFEAGVAQEIERLAMKEGGLGAVRRKACTDRYLFIFRSPVFLRSS